MALGMAALPLASAPARADNFPTRPIRLIVGFPAGSGPDIVARILGQGMSSRLGQSIVVEDRPGAGSNLATSDVAHAPPDGYMLMMLTTANVINATLYKNLNYDLLRDIAPVASIDDEPFVFEVTPRFRQRRCRNSSPMPRPIPARSPWRPQASAVRRTFSARCSRNGRDSVDHVPYRGNPIPDVISGHVDFFIGPMQSALEFIRTGKLRALGITTAQRSDGLPDVAPVADVVKGYEASGWLGIGAPKGTPADVIARLNKAVNDTTADPAVKAHLNSLGDIVAPRTSADFGLLMKNDVEKWAKVIQSANIKLEQ